MIAGGKPFPREECVNSTKDGRCWDECNTAKCPYDFQDCNSEKFVSSKSL